MLVMVLRGVADNFAAGVVIETRRPLHLGDLIEGLDHVGTVRELSSRAVVIETAEGRTVHLPNRQLLDGPIVNHSTIGACRSEVEVRVPGAGAHRDVADAIRGATATATGVLDDPACDVLLAAIELERVTARVRFWHAPPAGAAASSAVIEAVTDGLAHERVRITAVAPPPPPPLSPPPPLRRVGDSAMTHTARSAPPRYTPFESGRRAERARHDDSVRVLMALRDLPVPVDVIVTDDTRLATQAKIPGVVRVALRVGTVVERAA